MVSKVVNSSLRDFVSTQKSGSPAKKDSQVRTHRGRRESDTGPRGGEILYREGVVEGVCGLWSSAEQSYHRKGGESDS